MVLSPEEVARGLDFKVNDTEQAQRQVSVAAALAQVEVVRHALLEFPDLFFPYMEQGLDGKIFTDINLNRRHKLTLHNDFYDGEENRFMILKRERPGDWSHVSWQLNAQAGYSEHVVWSGTTSDAECIRTSPRNMVEGHWFSLAMPDYLAKAASAHTFIVRVLGMRR